MKWYVSLVSAVVAFYAVLIFVVNRIPHVTIKSFGWLAFKHVTITLPSSTIYIRKIYFRFHFFRWRNSPIRFLSVEFVDVNVSRTSGQNGNGPSTNHKLNIPQELLVAVPKRVHNFLISTRIINQIQLIFFRISICDEARRDAYTLFLDVLRLEANYNSMAKNKIQATVYNAYLRTGDPTSEEFEQDVLHMRSIEFIVLCTVIAECPIHAPSKYIWSFRNFDFDLAVDKLVVPVDHAKSFFLRVKPKSDPAAPTTIVKSRKHIEANLDLIDQVLKLVELTDIKFNDLLLSYGDFKVSCGNAAYSITPVKKFNTIPTDARTFTVYLTSTKLHHKGSQCLDLPSGTFTLDTTPMRLFRRIYNFMDNKCHDFGRQDPLNVASSITLTNSVIDIYHDQLDLIQHLIKPKLSPGKRVDVAPMIKHILAIVTEVKSKIVVVTTTVNMHFPKPSMSKIEKKEAFHRDAFLNMVVSISLQGFVHKFANKNLSSIMNSSNTKHKSPQLSSIFKFVGFEYMVAENVISLPKFSLKATYDVLDNTVALTAILKSLRASSVNAAIFHLAREIKNRNIEHSNRRYEQLLEQDDTPDTTRDGDRTYILLFEILPNFLTSIKVSVSSLQADVICNDGLPSFNVFDETLQRDVDLAEFKRGVSLKIDGFTFNYKKDTEVIVAKMHSFQCFTLSEYMSEYIPDFDLVSNYDDVQLSNVSDITSLDSRLSDEENSANLKRVKKVVNLRDLKIGNFDDNDRDLLTLMLPEADGRIDTFFIWCSIYARTLLHYFAPTVERRASKKKMSQMSGFSSILKLNVEVDSIAVVCRFPNTVDAMFEVESFRLKDVLATREAHIQYARLYVVHPAVKKWARLLSIADFKVNVGLDPGSNLVDVFATTIRLNIPYSFLFYTVFDNIITFAKAIRQIKTNFLNFVDGVDNYNRVLPEARDAIEFPSVRIRTKTLGMSLENDPFERELALIFELAKVENENRLRKIDLFDQKVESIRERTFPTLESQIELTYSSSQKLFNKHEPIQKSPLHNVVDSSTHKRKHTKKPSQPLPERNGNGDADTADLEPRYTEEEAETLIGQARDALNKNLSTAWIRKYNTFKNVKLRLWRHRSSRLWGEDTISEIMISKYDILDYADPPYLMVAVFPDFDLELSKARIDDLHEFLRFHGQGQPRLDYSILVPLYGHLRSKGLFVYIRDYPLPLVSFPLNSDASKNTIDFRGNMVVNEKLVTRKEEMRTIFVPFSPSLKEDKGTDNFYSVFIPRTLTPVKFMFDFECDLETDRACMLSWCKSYQAGISAVATAFDSFTKPTIDDSPLGWWDKVALLLHGRMKFNVPNELCLHMKGSTSPYELIGKAAGLVFCWKNNVTLNINQTQNPKELIRLDSDDFILGIPNYSSTDRKTWSLFYNEVQHDNVDNEIESEAKKFHKRVMKLTSSDRVQWTLGFDFERNVEKSNIFGDDQERTREFKPHYDVVVTHPKYEWHPDSYENYRSDYIHLAFSVISKSSTGNAFNAAYLTPLTFFYFFHWWNMMTKYTSLPVKQGPLFVNSPVSKSHVKMGLHLFTVKYQLIFEPLTISHLYKHSTTSLFDHKDKVAFTGLKGKCTSCAIDMHQRKETLQYINKKLNIDNKTMHLKMNEVEVDIRDADIRFLNAQFNDKAISAYLASYLDDSSLTSPSESRLTEGSQSFNSWFADFESSHDSSGPSWFDPDDLVELEVHETLSPYPKIRILPFLYTPKFSYIREYSLQEDGPYPFGREHLHDCILGQLDPEQTQVHLIDSRIESLDKCLEHLEKDSKEYKINRERVELLDAIKEGISGGDVSRRSSVASDTLSLERVKTAMSSYRSFNELKRVTSLNSSVVQFHNRFIFHNVQMKWDNRIRDLFMEYSEKISDRRSQMFFMGKRAVDLIREIQEKLRNDGPVNPDDDDHLNFQCGEDFISGIYDTMGKIDEENEEADNKYLVKFIHPQIQLISMKNKDSCMIVTSRDLEVRIVAVNVLGMNNVISEDEEVSANIETRYGVIFKDSHAFVFKKSDTMRTVKEAPYAVVHESGLANWPPWVDFEVCYDSSCMMENMVFERASMALKSVQPNILQNKENKELKSKLFVLLSKLVVSATSEQYNTLFYIASNLLIRGKTHQDELINKWNKLASLSDATEFEGLDKKVKSLQDSIKAASEILLKLDLKGITFDEKERESIKTFQLEMERRKLELVVLMRSIGLKSSKSKTQKQFARFTRIAADQVIWHLLDADREPFVDFALASASFVRLDYADGSNHNTVDVHILQGFNLRNGAVYPDLLMPYKGETLGPKDSLLELSWRMLDPVGGIVMIRDAKLKLRPLEVRLDHSMAQDLFKYLFPDSNAGDETEFENEVMEFSQSPLDEDTASVDEAASGTRSRNPLRKLIKKRVASPSSHEDSDDSSISTTSSKTRVDPHNDRLTTKCFGKDRKNVDPVDYADAVVSRLSKYYSIINFEVVKTIVRISYKAPRHLNIIDVHDLALSIPSLSYKDKIWSGEDFVLRLRKDVIKMILSNTGKIISNKFRLKKRHANQEPLKQISDYASYMTVKDLQSDGRARDATKTNLELKPHHHHRHRHSHMSEDTKETPGEEVYTTYFADEADTPDADTRSSDSEQLSV